MLRIAARLARCVRVIRWLNVVCEVVLVSQPIRTGTVASFAIADVVCPDAAQVLRQTGPELTVSGRVVYLSDSGARRNHFAIVDVGGIHAPLIVPVSRLRAEHAEAGSRDTTTLAGRAKRTTPASERRLVRGACPLDDG